MIRTFLGVGDKAGDAVITEGLPSVTCSSPPPRVNISTLYMKTWCSACEQEGFIAPRGPRRAGTGPNGQQWALSGDVNICGCNPPPVFNARRNMYMILEEEGSAELEEENRAPATRNRQVDTYDEQFTLRDANGKTLAGTLYTIRLPSGELQHGTTDLYGRTERHQTDGAQSVHIYLGHRLEV